MLFLSIGLTPLIAMPAKVSVISIQDPTSNPDSLSLLFLGHQENTHHSPPAVFSALSPTFVAEGINATFSSSLGSISEANLMNYDALMMYGNAVSSGASSSNQPLVPVIQQYVESGGALVGLHVASAAFRNDPRFAALLGGRFQQHYVGSFTPENIEPEHALIKGLTPLTSFDETYILKDLNPDIHVLQERIETNGIRYPWTWTRFQKSGRVFYTASGHVPWGGSTATYDSITKPEFPDLVLRGLHWTTRRHFSNFDGISLGSANSISGQGTHRATGLSCLWHDDGTGPITTLVEGDPILIDGDTYFWGGLDSNSMIALPDPANTVISRRAILNGTGDAFPGLWKSTSNGTFQTLALTGQPFPASLADEVIETLGVDFVANTAGESLFRAQLKNTSTSATRSIIATENSGIILSQGDTPPGLPDSVEVGDLNEGRLTINSPGNFAGEITLSDATSGLAISFNNTIIIQAIEGQPMSGLPGIFWGSPGYMSLNDDDELFFTTSLTGSVSSSNDSALVRYSLPTQQFTILMREGDSILGTNSLGELSDTSFVTDQVGQCHLFSEISGPLVTAANDQVLISIRDSPKVIIREGDSLPTFDAGSVIGSDLGSTPVIADESGTLYFTANVINGGNSRIQLFQAINSTLFGVIAADEIIPDGPGSALEVAAIRPFNPSTNGSGQFSPLQNGSLAIIVETTEGHQALLFLESLLDLDLDGISNYMEAGLGSDALNPGSHWQNLPKIEAKDGQQFYTYLRATQSGLPAPVLEESPDLENWIPSSSLVDPWDDQTGVPAGFAKVSVPVEQVGTESRFLRIGF
ncbi:ThuA domain-containing protein [Akkermansiaceae bacterium]|nr:ThuA domain-containing protein [Akkermansiaceae bacterium]